MGLMEINKIKYSAAEIAQMIIDDEDTGGDLTGIAAIQELLKMPDDKFEVLSDFFLAKFEDAITDSHFKLMAMDYLNKNDIAIEDCSELADSVLESIQTTLKEEGYSQMKIDFVRRLVMLTLNEVSHLNGIAHRIVNIPIELSEGVKLPKYAKEGDAGLDIYALEDYTIKPGETKIIPTGIKVAIPKGYAILIQPRSGQSAKTKLRITNSPGLIDSGFRNEIGVIVENVDPPIRDIDCDYDKVTGTPIIKSILFGSDIDIEKGQRFAQMRLVEAPKALFTEVKDISGFEGDRESGFGGTGKF